MNQRTSGSGTSPLGHTDQSLPSHACLGAVLNLKLWISLALGLARRNTLLSLQAEPPVSPRHLIRFLRLRQFRLGPEPSRQRLPRPGPSVLGGVSLDSGRSAQCDTVIQRAVVTNFGGFRQSPPIP